MSEISENIKEKISGRVSPEEQKVNKFLLVMIGIVFVLIGVAFIIFQQSTITAIFFFLVVVVMFIIGFKKRTALFWELGPLGITADTISYRYNDLRSFWIEYQPGYLKELSFQSKKWYHSYIKIPLNQENPLEIREFLLAFLPEERHEDTIIEIISRKLGI
jgi:c-di-AMP phosphodiesterase-like protein